MFTWFEDTKVRLICPSCEDIVKITLKRDKSEIWKLTAPIEEALGLGEIIRYTGQLKCPCGGSLTVLMAVMEGKNEK